MILSCPLITSLPAPSLAPSQHFERHIGGDSGAARTTDKLIREIAMARREMRFSQV